MTGIFLCKQPDLVLYKISDHIRLPVNDLEKKPESSNKGQDEQVQPQEFEIKYSLPTA